MTQTEIYFLSQVAIVAVCLVFGFLLGWVSGMILGYRKGVADVAESINEAGIIGDVEEVR